MKHASTGSNTRRALALALAALGVCAAAHAQSAPDQLDAGIGVSASLGEALSIPGDGGEFGIGAGTATWNPVESAPASSEADMPGLSDESLQDWGSANPGAGDQDAVVRYGLHFMPELAFHGPYATQVVGPRFSPPESVPSIG